jgi:dUTP pyrophosphatase
MTMEAAEAWPVEPDEFVTMEQMAKFTKESGFKPTLVSTGMKCKLDPDTWLQLSVRSSSPLKYWLMMGNSIGVIDADYRGEIGVILVNLSQEDFVINDGERIAQMVVARHETVTWEAVEDLDETERGAGGFGHTGKA